MSVQLVAGLVVVGSVAAGAVAFTTLVAASDGIADHASRPAVTPTTTLTGSASR